MARDAVDLRSLAIAVLQSAVHDVEGARVRARERDAARTFLAGGPLLDLWAGLAGFDAGRLSRRAARLVDGCPASLASDRTASAIDTGDDV
jgi:hypothetical protein